MTEEEAKTKWCPFARVAYLPISTAQFPPSFNRTLSLDGGVDLGSGTKCIGSQCMAWRWILVSTESSLTHQLPLLKHSDTQGYCGLVGKL